jgi:hypothetical protein
MLFPFVETGRLPRPTARGTGLLKPAEAVGVSFFPGASRAPCPILKWGGCN